jgi:hypothetical protein
MKAHVPDVGAPDPEHKTSPIVDEYAEYEETPPDVDLESGGCHFNGATYPFGHFVRSGSELLCCEKPGIWVRKGEMRPD